MFKPGSTTDDVRDLLAGSKTSEPSTRLESRLASTENKKAEANKRSDEFRMPPRKSSLVQKTSKLSLPAKVSLFTSLLVFLKTNKMERSKWHLPMKAIKSLPKKV